jgi:hypothetical protein
MSLSSRNEEVLESFYKKERKSPVLEKSIRIDREHPPL